MTTPVEVTGQRGEKGLLNDIGLHHCFLNVVIQSLWHIGSFRERFTRLAHHAHQRAGLSHDYVGVEKDRRDSETDVIERLSASVEEGEIVEEPHEPDSPAVVLSGAPSPDHSSLEDQANCVCCALKTIFIHYEHSDASIIPPDSLRFALSLLTDNHGQSAFAMRAMSDAEEALDQILQFLHFDAIGGSVPPPPPSSAATPSSVEESELSRSLDVTCTPTCVSHQVFGQQLMDQKNCTKCRATSDPEMSQTFLYRIYVEEIVRTKKQRKDWTLEMILRSNYLQQDYSCPSPQKQRPGGAGAFTCPGPAKIDRWMLSLPEVFTMMCVWANPETDRAEIDAFFDLLPMHISLDKFLRVQPAANVSISPPTAASSLPPIYLYRLRGMILYYGRHYVAIFWSQQFQSFVMFDDKRVTRLGDWQAVVARCSRGKLQPTVLFYESQDPAVTTRLQRETQEEVAQEIARKAEERKVAQTTTGALIIPDATSPQQQQSPHSLSTKPPIPPRPTPVPRPTQPSDDILNLSAIVSPTAVSVTHTSFHTHAQSPVGAASSTAAAPGIPPRAPVRQPPAIIPDYIPTSRVTVTHGTSYPANGAAAASDDDDAEWLSLWQENGAATPPFSTGYASPSIARSPLERSTSIHWVCAGPCQSLYSSSKVPYQQCPRCNPAPLLPTALPTVPTPPARPHAH